MDRSPVLQVEGLEKAFGRARVLEGVDLLVDGGQFVVLLGPPGSGKSALLGAIAGFVPTDRGGLTVLGRDVRQTRTANPAVGIVFREPLLDLDRSIVANLHYHAALQGIDRRSAAVIISAELERLALGANGGDPAKVLGPANRRRLDVVRALLHRPRLLLVDSGTANLDAEDGQLVLADARQAAARGTAVLWATDRPEEVRDGDRLAILHHGRIAFAGEPAALVAERNAGSLEAAYKTLTARRVEVSPHAQ